MDRQDNDSLADLLFSHFDNRVPQNGDPRLEAMVANAQERADAGEVEQELVGEVVNFVIRLMIQNVHRPRLDDGFTAHRQRTTDATRAQIDAAIGRVVGSSSGHLARSVHSYADRLGNAYRPFAGRDIANAVLRDSPHLGHLSEAVRERVRSLARSTPDHPRSRLG